MTWRPQVGDAVVSLASGGMGGPYRIADSTVARIGKRDLVLANGERFNAASLTRRNGTWDPSTRCLHPDDPEVARARLANLRASRQSAVGRAFDAFRRHPSHDTAKALEGAAHDYTRLADEP